MIDQIIGNEGADHADQYDHQPVERLDAAARMHLPGQRDDE